jgi:hypothetical protein
VQDDGVRSKPVLLGLVAVAGVVIGLVVVLVQRDDPDDGGAGVPVLTPEDAAYAVEGGDFEVVDEIATEDGVDTTALLPDGRLVEVVYSGDPLHQGDFTVELVDPGSGDRETLPSPWTDDGAEVYPVVTAVDHGRMWLAWGYYDKGLHQRAMVLDLATGDYEEYDEPALPLDGRVKIISHLYPDAEGRLWVHTGKQTCGDGECADPTHARLWSFDPEGSARPRVEAEPVEFAVHGDRLVWSEASDESTVHVRELSTGEEWTHAIDDCSVRQVETSGTMTAAACGEKQVLLDAEARPIAELRLGWDIAAVGDRWATAGSFAYDTETGRLLRLYDAGAWADYGTVSRGNLVVTPIGVSDPRAVNESTRFDSWAVVRMVDREDVVGEVGARAPLPFECWNGRRTRNVDGCDYPDGRKGIRWLFAESEADGCHAVDRDSARQRLVVSCERVRLEDGTVVDLRFLDWGPARGMERYYDDRWIGRLAAPQRHTFAFEIAAERGAAGVLRYNGLFTNELSVEIHADSRDDLLAAITALQLRPWAEYQGTLR